MILMVPFSPFCGRVSLAHARPHPAGGVLLRLDQGGGGVRCFSAPKSYIFFAGAASLMTMSRNRQVGTGMDRELSRPPKGDKKCGPHRRLGGGGGHRRGMGTHRKSKRRRHKNHGSKKFRVPRSWGLDAGGHLTWGGGSWLITVLLPFECGWFF